MSNPSNLKYTVQHEWVALEGDLARVGITEYAAHALGDVVFVEIPEPGTAIRKAEPCGELESTKSVSELFAPADGEVLERNQAAVEDPSLISSDPFGKGWLFLMRVTEIPELLDQAAYDSITEE